LLEVEPGVEEEGYNCEWEVAILLWGEAGQGGVGRCYISQQ
jgi:hypothetical protein